MTLAVISQLAGAMDVLELTKEEQEELRNKKSDISDFYDCACRIAVKHGYDTKEAGVTVIAAENLRVFYEKSYYSMTL